MDLMVTLRSGNQKVNVGLILRREENQRTRNPPPPKERRRNQNGVSPPVFKIGPMWN